jgi:hypothetical protein
MCRHAPVQISGQEKVSFRLPARAERRALPSGPHTVGKSNFTTLSGVCDAPRLMRTFAWIGLLCAVVLTGCTSSRITNLTPTRQPRNATGVYPVELAWDSNQQSIIESSLKPFVVVGFDFYPMRPALNIKNRWETVIPVPADKNTVIYHFKVDYEYRAMGKGEKSSKLSPEYRLDIQ